MQGGELEPTTGAALQRPTRISRRKLLYGAGAFAAAGLLAYSTGIERFEIEVQPVELHLPRLPDPFDGFTIAQLSDLHYRSRIAQSPIAEAVAKTIALRADLAVITGDFVTVKWLSLRIHKAARRASRRLDARNAEPCAADLLPLVRAVPTIAVLGNHDCLSNGDVVQHALSGAGLTVLRNAATPLERGGKRLWVAGIDDALEGRPDLTKALTGIPRGESTILLVHEPDFADTAAGNNIDLQISGHSHGGQVRFPFVGPLYLPPLARKYPIGLRKVGPMVLYTNRGIGTVGPPLRFNCPPEITVFTLRQGATQVNSP